MDIDDEEPNNGYQYTTTTTPLTTGTTAPAPAPATSVNAAGTPMTQADQQDRRSSIRDILADDFLTPLEKRRSIQSLMDGRRRSSNATHSSNESLARAAQEAAEFYNSDVDADDKMDDIGGSSVHSSTNNNNNNNTNNNQATTSLSAAATAVQGGGHDVGQGENEAEEDNPHYRRFKKERSTSMPLWSEGGVQAVVPLAAANNIGSNAIWDDPININRRMEKSRPACNHYERNNSIISPCCGLAFGCRICHDECATLPMPFSKRPLPSAAFAAVGDDGVDPNDNDADGTTNQQPSRINWKDNVEGVKQKQEKRRSLPLGFEEEETHHEIDRFAIKEIICRLCYVRQSSKTNFCSTCEAQFGAYHCTVCNLWMSDEESPYHCSDCGFCRVGGRENFRHCDDCGMCIDTLLFDDHNCKAGKYMSNCPVCQEDLFSSRDASHEMPCGHAIHWHCFKELTSYDTRCPVCKKTAETPEHMAPTWQAMAMGIALQPVPPELARVVTITCNDCEERDEDRRWHFLGVRCLHCMSFNTTVERTTLTGREAAAYLDELDLARGGPSSKGEMDADPMDAS